MSEFLRSNLESFEGDRGYDSDITELAVDGLSRVVGERDGAANDDSDYEEENDYGEEDDYDDDDYYSEYDEQHYGEERADFDEEKIFRCDYPWG